MLLADTHVLILLEYMLSHPATLVFLRSGPVHGLTKLKDRTSGLVPGPVVSGTARPVPDRSGPNLSADCENERKHS
jgi:hypothetical protein